MKFGPKKRIAVLLAVLWSALSYTVLMTLGLDLLVWLIGVLTVGAIGIIGHVAVNQRRSALTLDRLRRHTASLALEGETGAKRSDEMFHELREAKQGIQDFGTNLEWLGEVLSGTSDNLERLSSHVGDFSQFDPDRMAGIEASITSVESSIEELARATSQLRYRSESPIPSDGLARILAANPRWAEGTSSSRRINELVRHYQSEVRYLEVGVEAGRTLEAVQAPVRVGVEPIPRFSLSNLPGEVWIHAVPSDEYFGQLSSEREFEVIFIDGLHTLDQVYRDLMNSLRHLSRRGTVLIDDTVPSDGFSSIPDRLRSLDERAAHGVAGRPWHGDVYRLIPIIRDWYPQLRYATIVGSGNPQTLVWWPDRSVELRLLSSDELSRYRALEYDDLFDDGVPTYFCPADEDEALEQPFVDGEDRPE